MKLNKQITQRRNSRGPHSRFFTSLDMAIIKHDESVQNARKKRGEVPHYVYEYIAPCGCGVEGCFIHSGVKQNRF